MKIYSKWLTTFHGLTMVNPSWSRDELDDGRPWSGGQTVARVGTFTGGLIRCNSALFSASLHFGPY